MPVQLYWDCPPLSPETHVFPLGLPGGDGDRWRSLCGDWMLPAFGRDLPVTLEGLDDADFDDCPECARRARRLLEAQAAVPGKLKVDEPSAIWEGDG